MKQNPVETKIVEIEGQQVSIKTYKPKKKKITKNASPAITTCPYCLSTLRLNGHKVWECSGDQLKLWEKEFLEFLAKGDKEKGEYLQNLSNYGRFIELYDKWKYSIDNNLPEEFNCGYTNSIYSLTNTITIKIPDPIVVKKLEHKLGRKLTEEELVGESELYFYAGRVLTEWRKRAKIARIPYIILPSEDTIYL